MLLISAALLIVVGLPVALFVRQLDRNYYEFSTDLLEITSNVVFEKVHDGMLTDPTTIDSRLEDLAIQTPVQLVRIYKPDGTIVFSSDAKERGQNIFSTPAGPTVTGTEHTVRSFERVGRIYSHHHPLYAQAECLTCHENRGELIGVLDVHARSPQSEKVYAYAKSLSITGGVLIIVILILVTNLVYEGQIERRLQSILNGFDALAGGDMNVQVKMKGDHELATMASRFNETVRSLKQARREAEAFYEMQLEHADRLVTLGEVATEIAHEVNNPAGIIRGRTELMKGDLESGKTLETEDLDTILRQTGRISEITKNILHYVQKRSRHLEEIDLVGVVDRAIGIMRPLVSKRNVEVDSRYDLEHAWIMGNALQLEQVVCNLITNSLNAFSGSSGTNRIEIGITQVDGDRFSLSVTDNGPGIPAEIRDRIFSPFFTTSRNGDGTGLGLFICRNIVRSHGGDIHLDSAYMGGTRMLIELEKQVSESSAVTGSGVMS